MSEARDAVRKLDEAQARMKQPPIEVYTDRPTPMTVPVAIGVLLRELRRDHGAMIAELRDVATPEPAPLDMHAQAHSSMDYLLSLDLGCTEREDRPELYDAIATLKMIAIPERAQ